MASKLRESEEEGEDLASEDERCVSIAFSKCAGDHIQNINLAVANSWFQSKQDAILHKIPQKIKMDGLKFKLEIVEAL
ncbi:hypothetical protein TNCV_4198071 [Trichonephila clavipes]|nr:hypothetical protein TNCV_4198071 [Trichonephila clavipes]